MSETSVSCCVCDKELELQVCKSAAGFYLGHWCDQCGPHDRQSGYMPTQAIADKALAREMALFPHDSDNPDCATCSMKGTWDCAQGLCPHSDIPVRHGCRIA